MQNLRHIKVDVSEAGNRLDTFLARKTGITRSQIQKLIGNGDVLVNNAVVSQNYRTKGNEVISMTIPSEEKESLVPEQIPVEILYKDDAVVVVNKPAGMVVYPAAGHVYGTLMNALAFRCEKLANIGGPLRPGVVHRLDRDTSGVMVVALDDRAYYDLVEQFRKRTIHRKYMAMIYGNPRNDSGEITVPIGRSESDRKKMSTRTRRGKEAITRWKVLKRFGAATLVEVKLGTGRTHQIRVHLSSIGYPILGDRTYGRKSELEVKGKKVFIPRQMLHAEMLGFTHPFSGEYMEFSGPMPVDMREVMDKLSAGVR
ncbi:MAG TPA: RluA family pseudouridine synthase [Thermodesulfovibrionales bacterium]|nr:RluA family pseudouridine synthase [Thermodesulfovibrionales bacterium]